MSIYLYMPAAMQTHVRRLCRMWDNVVWRTSEVSRLAAVGSLTRSRQRVPQGANGRVLDPQRRTHQQQHRLPGALHLAPTSGSTSFTLRPPGRQRDTHNEISFWCIFFYLHTCPASTHLYACSTLLMSICSWSKWEPCWRALQFGNSPFWSNRK